MTRLADRLPDFPWDLLATLQPHDMTIATVPRWVDEHGDAWASMNDHPQSLEPLLAMVRADQAAGLEDALPARRSSVDSASVFVPIRTPSDCTTCVS